MGGICVDIMQAIESINPDIQFDGYQTFLPFRRLQTYLESGKLDVFFGFKKTENRMQKYHFLDIPLYQLNYVVAVRMSDTVSIETFDDIRSLGEAGKVLTIYGSAASKFLHQQGGLLVDDKATSPSMLLKKLMGKRGRFAFYHDLGLQKIIEDENLKKEIRILPVSFLKYHHFAAFSKKVPTETILSVGAALEKLENNGELASIRRKYNLVEQEK
jgi:ABC-type amino acid transport substrate-binding protein